MGVLNSFYPGVGNSPINKLPGGGWSGLELTDTLIKRFIAATIGNIQKLRRERLRELEVPWLTKKVTRI